MTLSLTAAALPLRAAQRVDIARVQLEPWPLDPSSIKSGNPQAEGLTLSRSADRCTARGVWACSPGAFRWVWTYDETLVVVDGSASVELRDMTLELRAGDFAFFERGQSSIWRIRTPLRKAFHATAAQPLDF